MRITLTLLFAIASLFVWAQDYKLEGSEVKPEAAITFKIATATLKPESDVALKIIKKYLDDRSYITLLRVEGHMDTMNDELGGTKESANQVLSERRALAVCKRLIELGVDCKRLIAVGFGSTKPIANNDTEEGRKANRRISFFNVSLRGHVIGGLPTDGGGKVAGDTCE